MGDLQKFIENAIQNITEDRAATKTLLASLMKYMVVSEDRHKEVGMVAAKYVETLQRSNEQLVKITALLHKQSATEVGISKEEKDELFDLIQNSGEEEDD